jgi:hypothetical protein
MLQHPVLIEAKERAESCLRETIRLHDAYKQAEEDCCKELDENCFKIGLLPETASFIAADGDKKTNELLCKAKKLLACLEEEQEKLNTLAERWKKAIHDAICVLQSTEAENYQIVRQIRELANFMRHEEKAWRKANRRIKAASKKLRDLKQQSMLMSKEQIERLLKAMESEDVRKALCQAIPKMKTLYKNWSDARCDLDTIQSPPPDPLVEARQTLCQQPNELIEWLAARGVNLENISEKTRKIALLLEGLKQWPDIASAQWRDYKASYEMWWTVPEIRSHTDMTPGN